MKAGDYSLKDVMLGVSTWLILSLFLAKALGYVFNILFIKLFTQEQYGSFVYAWSWGLFLCGMMMPNIPAAVIRYVAYYRGKSDQALVKSTIRTALALTAILLPPAIALSYVFYLLGFIKADMTVIAFIFSVFAINFVACLFSAVISGYRRPDVSSILNLVQQALRIFAVALAAFLAVSTNGIFFLVGFGFLLYMLVVALYEWKNYGLGSKFNWRIAKDLVSYGVYMIFFTTAGNLVSWFGIFFIRYFLSAEAVAVYHVALLASGVNLVFFLAVLQIFSPVVSELFGAGRKDRIIYLTSYILETFFLMFLPMFLLLIIFAKELLIIFSKADYVSGAVPMQILSIGAFFAGISFLFIELIAAEGKPQANARNIGLGALLNVVLNVALIPTYGMVGAAVSNLMSWILILGLSYLQVKSVVRPSFSARRILRIVLAAGIVGASVVAVKAQACSSMACLVLSCLLLPLVYLGILIASRSLRTEDVSLAEATLQKFMVPAGIRSSVVGFLRCGIHRSKTW